ncbi:MAG: monofunctional biosynthetic peptidoglycan transglycosylase [Xanthomonadales bacterium]|nr:monofunctional biosynthetic peptidoglycan transglycosylase [Xanthomonadales bacterium]
MKPRAWWKRLLRWLLAAVLAFIATSVLVVFVFRFAPVPTSAFMLERRLDAALGGEHGLRIVHEWTPIEAMSAQLPIAMVAAEDQKFPHHHGFDVEAIQAAMADAEDGERLRGASTISQQVAKNLFLWSGRSFVRKGLEAYFTVLIEVMWPKRRILEVYLNIAEFGDGVYGVAAAAEHYFKRRPDAIDARQAALLAAVLPNPRKFRVDAPSPYVQRRAAWIERQARQLGGPDYLAD